MKHNKALITALSVICLLVIAGVIFGRSPGGRHNSTKQLHVVAAENFWGSLITQLGGDKVQVSSIVTDPNADPHEYESNTQNARDIANANLVIVNGVGYDDWAGKLISANPNNSRTILNVGTLVGQKVGDNPHLWYNPAYVNAAVDAMTADLVRLDPRDTVYYQQQNKTVHNSLSIYQQQLYDVRSKYAGVNVAATEDVATYFAQSSGLRLISPQSFMQAVAEGNDPPTESVVQFQELLESGNVKLLIYNYQTVTPITSSMKALAKRQHIPIVGISETLQPNNVSFQTWMSNEIASVQQALEGSTK